MVEFTHLLLRSSIESTFNRKNTCEDIMALLTDDELNSIQIAQIIFHVVGRKDEDLVLHDDVDLGAQTEFFLDQIKNANKGSRCEFLGETTGIRAGLTVIHNSPERFVEISKELARSFHGLHKTGNTKKGAFIFARLSGSERSLFAIVKVDDLRVLNFQQKVENGEVSAIVRPLDNTFLDDKNALQKSALCELVEGVDGFFGNLAVRDKSKKNIADYFVSFLGVRRSYKSTEATDRFQKALEVAFRSSQNEAPKNVRTNWRNRLFDYVEANEGFNPEDDLDNFGASVFGAFWANERFRQNLDKSFEAEKIADEAFVFDKNRVKRPRIRKYTTLENVQITVPREADSTVTIETDPISQRKKIVIETEDYVEDALKNSEA